jgi:hypothetical protein
VIVSWHLNSMTKHKSALRRQHQQRRLQMKSSNRQFVMMLLSLVAVSGLMMVSGCVTTEEKQNSRVVAAARIIGEAAAQVTPSLPPECREHMRRIYPKVGEKYCGSQLRWESSADAIDAQIDRCAQFNDEWAGKAK